MAVAYHGARKRQSTGAGSGGRMGRRGLGWWMVLGVLGYVLVFGFVLVLVVVSSEAGCNLCVFCPQIDHRGGCRINHDNDTQLELWLGRSGGTIVC